MTDWRQRKWFNFGLLLLSAVLVFALIQLGNWQLRRLEWKNALLDAIETRAFGNAVLAPELKFWNEVTADTHAYQRVKIEGTLLHGHELIVRALTELGGGYWVLTPLRREDGSIIWINRGFVPPDKRLRTSRAAPETEFVSLTGLLRMNEPGGTLLQDNDPANNRWYSRDVDAFSVYRSLPEPAPYFIDAGADVSAKEWPRGGLTRLTFSNNHLHYALTWYTMAFLLATATLYTVRLSRRTLHSRIT
ncbi:SURF1 family protein [Labrenzia sp. CE80]|uniref:SURF1 family protein n=1 Tax=Labrenzia sp. CE80 TaxID=1788986 RepID=UPI00129B661F|nr:SURF1 family protein [Labrenzia sp. CE80]